MIKHPDKEQFGGQTVYLAPNSRLQSIIAEKSKKKLEAAGPPQSRAERMNACWPGPS